MTENISTIEANQLYLHFKGTTYLILGLGKHTETEETVVIYQEWKRQPGSTWVRPLSSFVGSCADGTPRFTLTGYAAEQKDPVTPLTFKEALLHNRDELGDMLTKYPVEVLWRDRRAVFSSSKQLDEAILAEDMKEQPVA